MDVENGANQVQDTSSTTMRPSFDALYEEYGDDVLRMAYYYLADRQKAEDVCQEVFVRLYTNWDKISAGKEHAWLMRVTVNCCRDIWRSSWIKRVVLGSPQLELIPAEDEIAEREKKELIMKAVYQLPMQFREIILLFYYQGFGINEIAEMLGVPDGTVASRLSRARSKLEKILKEEMPNE